MTALTDAVDDLVGLQSDGHDIRACVRRTYDYKFNGYRLRLWNGQGVLFAGGEEWIGTVGPDGQDYHQVPRVTDPRDGANPEYRFGIPFVDRATFDALRVDSWRVAGRELVGYRVLLLPSDGLRASTAPDFCWKMTMREAAFSQSRSAAGMVYRAEVLCRSVEEGRARVPGGSYSDTAQRERARLAGVASDSFCVFVAANARRSIHIAGG